MTKLIIKFSLFRAIKGQSCSRPQISNQGLRENQPQILDPFMKLSVPTWLQKKKKVSIKTMINTK